MSIPKHLILYEPQARARRGSFETHYFPAVVRGSSETFYHSGSYLSKEAMGEGWVPNHLDLAALPDGTVEIRMRIVDATGNDATSIAAMPTVMLTVEEFRKFVEAAFCAIGKVQDSKQESES